MIIRSDETADIAVPGAPGPMRLHLFRPAVPGRFPGTVLYFEIYQVTAPIRRLAASGRSMCSLNWRGTFATVRLTSMSAPVAARDK